LEKRGKRRICFGDLDVGGRARIWTKHEDLLYDNYWTEKVSDLSHVYRVGTRDKTNGLGFRKVLGKGGWVGIVIHVRQEIAGLRWSREGMGQHTVRGKEI